MVQTGHNKKEVIEALRESHGIVTDACKTVGIARSSFYRWLNDDEDFKAEVYDATEQAKDFVEGKLYQNIEKGDVTSIIFYMKSKAKDRGYSEKIEQAITVDVPTETWLKMFDE